MIDLTPKNGTGMINRNFNLYQNQGLQGLCPITQLNSVQAGFPFSSSIFDQYFTINLIDDKDLCQPIYLIIFKIAR